MSADNTLCIEVAWEVCNQVGGIYTVIRTKVPAMISEWGDSYLLIGPYNAGSAKVEFEPEEPEGYLADVISRMNSDHTVVHYGRWLVPGEPPVLLIDASARSAELGNYKKFLWDRFRVSTVNPDSLVDEVLLFTSVAAELLREIAGSSGNKVLAHFHEWMAGPAILSLKQEPSIRTVFTTHATLVGRYVAGDNRPLYQELEQIDANERAAHYGILSRHLLERASAQECDVFTTVSEVTGRESIRFLGRQPDYLLPNGLNAHHFTALHEFQNLHRLFKEKINEFVMGHFFPSYTFDLDRTLYLFISGRYEYRNKGMDVFLAALERLNTRLQAEKNPPTVIAFIITNRPTRHISVDVLKSSILLHDLRTLTGEIKEQMGEKLLRAALERKLPTYEELLPRDSVARLKRTILGFSRNELPGVTTHDLSEGGDPVIEQLRASGLKNAANQPVKVVFHPEFVSSTNPPFHLDYDQFVRGCHLGVFPSYYEPWGYTPLECIALGLPTVTTDLSGFGGYVQEHISNSESSGILVLKRSMKDDKEIIVDLANYLFWFSQRSRRERIEMRNKAERLTEHFDWTSLIKHYHEAHEAALKGAAA
ncbi:MAG: glycosyltransferase [Bdellovibrionota bacterium]